MSAEREAIDDPTAGFADDPRYSFDTVSGKWQYEADDGTELEYDTVARAWVPLVRI
jgi:HIV Tat-specific factor 1